MPWLRVCASRRVLFRLCVLVCSLRAHVACEPRAPTCSSMLVLPVRLFGLRGTLCVVAGGNRICPWVVPVFSISHGDRGDAHRRGRRDAEWSIWHAFQQGPSRRSCSWGAVLAATRLSGSRISDFRQDVRGRSSMDGGQRRLRGVRGGVLAARSPEFAAGRLRACGASGAERTRSWSRRGSSRIGRLPWGPRSYAFLRRGPLREKLGVVVGSRWVDAQTRLLQSFGGPACKLWLDCTVFLKGQ